MKSSTVCWVMWVYRTSSKRSFRYLISDHSNIVLSECIINIIIHAPAKFQDDSYQFKDIKQLVMGMLEKYNYEEVATKQYSALLHVLVFSFRLFWRLPITSWCTMFEALWHICARWCRRPSPLTPACVSSAAEEQSSWQTAPRMTSLYSSRLYLWQKSIAINVWSPQSALQRNGQLIRDLEPLNDRQIYVLLREKATRSRSVHCSYMYVCIAV